MSDDQKNTWDSLAEQLGATPRPAEESKIDQPASAASTPPQDREYREPPRPASGWDSLLGDFGMESTAKEPQTPPVPGDTHDREDHPASEASSAVEDDELVTDWPTDSSDSDLEETAIFVRGAKPGAVSPGDSAFLQIEPAGQDSREDKAPKQQPTGGTRDSLKQTGQRGLGGPAPAPESSAADENLTGAAGSTEKEPPKSKWDLAPKSQLSLPDWFPFAGKRSKPPLLPPEEPVEHLEETLLEKPQDDEPTLFVDPSALAESEAETEPAESGEAETDGEQGKRPR
ncbi:MAG: hypothetical protein KDA37_17765, partial [Planctomycetales bacterium]|nr:hypothetical protein [Planctomycetales bacterium]